MTMSCAKRNVRLIGCYFVIFTWSLARLQQVSSTPAERCILGERLFNAALVNATKKFGDGLVAEEVMGVTIDSTDWSELNLTQEEAKECLKEYFKDEETDDITNTNTILDLLPSSDEADDVEKVTTYLKPYNYRQKGHFVKTPKAKKSPWSKVTHYYDKVVDELADAIGISD